MGGLKEWMAIGALATACGCASFKPRSALQNDSSGRPSSSTIAVRTARFAGEGGPAAGPIIGAVPATGVSAAAPPNTAQPASVAQSAPPTSAPPPTTPMVASAAPAFAASNPAVGPMLSLQAAPPANWNYTPSSSAPWVGAATSVYRANGPTGSSFAPQATSFGGAAFSGTVPGTAGLPTGAPSGFLTPSAPLSQRAAGLKLHPNPQPGSTGQGGSAMPNPNASLPGSSGAAPFALPNGGRDGFNLPSNPSAELNPSTSRRDTQPQLSPGRPPALDSDGLGGSRKDNPPLDRPGSGGSADALKRAFTPSAGDFSPPEGRKGAPGDPFEPPARPSENSNPPFKPLPPPAGSSQGAAGGTLQPPPPVNLPRSGELAPPGSR